MINCKIVSPQKTLFLGPVKSITLPSLNGEIQILPGHAESFFLLKKGKIILETRKKKEKISISEGVFYITNDSAIFIISDEEPK